MKQQTKLAAYITFMTLLITGVLFISGSKDHNICPVCNHSIASEGLVNAPPTAEFNQK